MRDYPQGAFEALCWVKFLLEDQSTRCRGCQRVLEEIEDVLEKMKEGAAIDFKYRFSTGL